MTSSCRSVTSRLIRAAVGAALVCGMSACGVENGDGGDSSSAGGDAGYPTKAVELTAPSGAGGSTDLISRALAKSAEKPFGQSVVVVNKEGANGAVGGKEVLSSRPDGYKMVLLPQSLFAITPLVEQDSDAIDLADMSYVAGVSVEDYVMTVPESSPIKSLDDLIKKGSVKFGTTGAGTGSQLAQALLFASEKVEASDVPFDGGAELVTALLGKQVDVGANQIAEAAPQIKAGKLRAIAVFSAERLDSMPDVKTAKEQGSDIVVNQRRWLAAPKDVPEDVLTKMRESVATAKDDPAFAKFLEDNFVSRWDVEPDDVKAEVEAAKQQYGDLAKRFGAELTTD
jgi:tripartite-type tricarboxylate transporter receptor subunit TctC